MPTTILSHLWTMSEIADLAGTTERHVRHIGHRNHLRPSPWKWRPHWPEPRFHDDAIPAWLRAIHDYPADSFDGEPPPLERPSRVFERNRRPSRSAIEELDKLCAPRKRRRIAG